MLDKPHIEDGKSLPFHINYDVDKPEFLKKSKSQTYIGSHVYEI